MPRHSFMDGISGFADRKGLGEPHTSTVQITLALLFCAAIFTVNIGNVIDTTRAHNSSDVIFFTVLKGI